MSDSTYQAPMNRKLKRLIDGLTYQAVKSGNSWMLPLGTDAAAGEYITVNGRLGQATEAIVGGTDAIVENANWVSESSDGILNIFNNKALYEPELLNYHTNMNTTTTYDLSDKSAGVYLVIVPAWGGACHLSLLALGRKDIGSGVFNIINYASRLSISFTSDYKLTVNCGDVGEVKVYLLPLVKFDWF